MLNLKYFTFTNLIFNCKKNVRFFKFVTFSLDSNENCIAVRLNSLVFLTVFANFLLYRRQFLLPLISYIQFLSSYYSSRLYFAKYHLIGLTFSMGLANLSPAVVNRCLVVRMNQAHYSLFRFPDVFFTGMLEKHGWILRFTMSNLSSFYKVLYRLHSLRSLFPYKIKGFLLFPELPFQEQNVFSGKQEKKPTSEKRAKKGKAKAEKNKESAKALKAKRGRKV